MKYLAALFLLFAVAWAQQPVSSSQPAGTAGSLSASAANSGACGGTSCVTLTTTANGGAYSVASVTVHGTYTGSTLNFEFSDDGGTTYYATQCSETNAAA